MKCESCGCKIFWIADNCIVCYMCDQIVCEIPRDILKKSCIIRNRDKHYHTFFDWTKIEQENPEYKNKFLNLGD